ncbi:MAG: MFS transporter [Terriglobia bacterium]|jgi:MFS family permease
MAAVNKQSAAARGAAEQGYRLPRNVWTLAWVAFLNDTATEMGYWLLPQFLVAVLGAQPMTFGLIEGAAETVSSFGRLLSGWLSDRLRRRKPLAAAGYTLANLVKPLLALAQSWGQVFWIRFADRAAKGFRAAPRDALIVDSVDPAHRGAAFGLRQAMDTAGAIVGPLSAIVLLPLFAGKVRNVFWMAAIPGLASVLLAWFAVKEVRAPAKTVVISTSSAGSPDKAQGARLGLILAAVGLFSLGNSSDLFLVLRAQNLGMSAWMAPALGLLFNVVYTVLSWPAGKLSDRVPRRRLVVAGYLIYAAVYAGFALLHTPQMVWFLFAVYGSYYALTEGVIKAWVADLVPSASRASVFGVLNWVVGVAALPASLLAGWIWQRYSPAAPFALSSLFAFLAALLLLFA